MNVLVKDQLGGSSTTSPVAYTLASTPVSGNLLFAFIASNRGSSTARTVSSITETNVVWAQLASCTIANTFLGVEIWKGVVSASASTSVSIAFSGTVASGAVVEIIEISGCSGNVDVTAVTKTGTSTSPTTTAYTPLIANDLILTCVGYASLTAPSVLPGGKFTDATFKGIGSCGIQGEFTLDGAPTAQAPTWTIGNVLWATIMVGLKVTVVDTGLTPSCVNVQPTAHYIPTVTIF